MNQLVASKTKSVPGPLLEQLLHMRKSMDQMLAMRNVLRHQIEQSKGVRDTMAQPGFTWANDYGQPPKESFLKYSAFTSQASVVAEIAQLSPKEQVTGLLGIIPAGSTIDAPAVDMAHAPEILAWMQFSLKSIDALFIYGQSMESLIGLATKGHDEALLKAVSIDRAVLEIAEIAARVRQAEAVADRDFLDQLQKRMAGPSGKIQLDHPLLRYFLWMLRDTGDLAKLGFQERYELFCRELCVYPDDTEDPAGSLDKFIQRWEKSLSTSK